MTGRPGSGDGEQVGRREHATVAVVAVVAGLPSAVAGFVGSGYLTDDWAVSLVFDRLGVADGIWDLSFRQPGRPLAGPYYAAIYEVIGDRAAVQGLVMAVVNAALLVACWAYGRRHLPSTILWPALIVVALAPNHAMTRLWFVAGTYPLSVALFLFGLVLLESRRPIAASALFVAATLLYEGPLALALTLVGLWVLPRWHDRLRPALVVAVPTLAAAATSFLLSSKRDVTGPEPFENAESFLSSQMGVALWGSPLVAQIAGTFVLVALTAALASRLPSFRSSRPEFATMLIAAALVVVAAAPFFYSGSIFGTTGVFDRNNLVPGLAAAVVLGSVWSLLRARFERLAVVVGVAVAGLFVSLQVEDVDNYIWAVERGDEVAAALAAQPVDDRAAVVVVPPQDARGTGLAAFIYDGDLTGAMRQRYGGDWRRVRLIENVSCDAPPAAERVQIFDWVEESVQLLDPGDFERRCPAYARPRSRS